MFLFIIIIYFSITLVIFIKNLLIPSLLFLILPLSDFRSTLFELFILISGVLTLFLFFRLGSFASRFFNVNFRSMIVSIHIFFLPLVLTKSFSSFHWLMKWNELFIDLIAEPYRLLTFTYQSSEIIGLSTSISLFLLGVVFHTFEEKRRKLIPLGRTLNMER